MDKKTSEDDHQGWMESARIIARASSPVRTFLASEIKRTFKNNTEQH